MNKAAKMMIAREAVKRSGGNNWENAGYGGARNEYDPMKYGMGGNEMSRMGGYGYGDNGVEARRRRDRRGRYMMGGMDYQDTMIGFDREDDEMEMRSRPYRPPMGIETSNKGPWYAAGAVWPPDKHGMIGQNRMQQGSTDYSKPVDEHKAMKWVKSMEVDDGTDMPMFKIDQTEVHRKAICPDCNMWEFFVVMNMMYADYCETAKAMNIAKPEFYARLAKNWLKDKDAGEHKLQKYMECVVE